MNARWTIVIGLVTLATIGVVSSTCATSPVLERLPHRRQIEMDSHTPGGAWIAVFADDGLAAATHDFADVRISDAGGRLVPHFTISPREADVRWRATPSDSLAWRDDPRAGRVLDLQLDPTDDPVLIVFPDAAALAGSGIPSIRVLGGRDGRRWRSLDASISTMTDHSGTVVIVTVPPRPPRHVRLIAPTDPIVPLPDISLYTESSEPAPREEAHFAVTTDRRDLEWRCTLELQAGQWVSGVVLEANDQSAFWQSRIELEVAADQWRELSDAETRTTRSNAVNRVAFSPAYATRVRVSIEGADGATPPVTPAAVEVIPTRIVVRVPTDAGTLWVNYGDPLLEDPGTVEQPLVMRTVTLTRASLGPEVANPSYVQPGIGWQWARRHPASLTIAMAIILAAIALIVLRDARSTR